MNTSQGDCAVSWLLQYLSNMATNSYFLGMSMLRISWQALSQPSILWACFLVHDVD